MHHFLILFSTLVLMATLNQDASAQRLRLETRLSGPTLASGKAKFESRGNRRKFDAEIQNARVGTTFTVLVRRGAQTTNAGSFTTNQFGRGGLDLDTTDGHNVPVLRTGDVVEIRQNGNIIVTGALRER